MSLKAVSALSRGLGVSFRPLLALRSVGAEFAAAPVLWAPPRAPQAHKAPSLVRHASSVAGAAVEGPPVASDVLPSTSWWGQLPEKKREKLLVALSELEEADGRLPLELALAALEKLETPPDALLFQTFASCGFIRQLEFGLRTEKNAMDVQTRLLSSLLSVPINASLRLVKGENYLSDLGVELHNSSSKAWVIDLPEMLAKAGGHYTNLVEADNALNEELRRRREALEAERVERQKALKAERVERQKALKAEQVERQKALKAERAKRQKLIADTKSAMQVCEAEAGAELWSILKGCGVLGTIRVANVTWNPEGALSAVKQLSKLSVADLAGEDAADLCSRVLPKDFPRGLARRIQKQLEKAVQSAWFNEAVREHEVVNLGLPLRALLIAKRGDKAKARAVLKTAGVTDASYIDRLLNIEQKKLDALADNFGWLLNVEAAFKRQDAWYWDVVHAFRPESPLTAERLEKDKEFKDSVDPVKDIKWSTGCYPVFVNGEFKAAVLRIPIWESLPFLLEDEKTDLTSLPLDEVTLPGLRPGAHGFLHLPESEVPQEELKFTTYVLTRSRARLLVKAAYNCLGAQLGTMTTAVHGTGKSASLRALAAMIGIGAGGDVMYLSESEVLAPNSDKFDELLNRLLQGGFSFSCGRSLRTPVLCQQIAEIGMQGTDAHLAFLRAFVSRSVFNAGDFKSSQKGGVPSAFIIDEANRLQDQLMKEHTEHVRWWALLKRLMSWKSNARKVAAFSPDFHAAALRQTKQTVYKAFDTSSSADKEHPFFEMQRLDPSLALKLMLGPAEYEVPEGLTYAGKKARPVDSGAGKDTSLQLPPLALAVVKDDKQRELLRKLIHSLGGVPRSLRRVVKIAGDQEKDRREIEDRSKNKAEIASLLKKRGLAANPEEWFFNVLHDAWKESMQSMQIRCFDHFSDKSLKELAGNAGGLSVFWNHSLAASSILSRINPKELALEDNVEFSSHTARHAYMRALFQKHTEAAKNRHDPATQEAWEALLSGATVFGTGQLFEDSVTTLLELGLFGSEYTPLSNDAGKPPTQMLRTYSFGLDKDSFPAERVKHEVTGAGLSPMDVQIVQNLEPGNTHVVRTPHVFPAVDFVVFRRPKESEQGQLEVAFIETTISSLSVHGYGRTLGKLKFAGAPPEDLKDLQLPNTLKDIANLACNLNYHTELDGNRVKFTQAAGKRGQQKTTMANSILWMFGVPIDLNCTIKSIPSTGHFTKMAMDPTMLSEEQRRRVGAATAELLRLATTQAARDPVLSAAIFEESASPTDLGQEVTDHVSEASEAASDMPGVEAEAMEVQPHADAQVGSSTEPPLMTLIRSEDDVKVYFIYCTSKGQDKGEEHHDLKHVDIPGFFGVFKDGFLPPEMKSLESQLSVNIEESSPLPRRQLPKSK